uniref:Uncharacterized protein n=1 Tax=Picea glauca TaxID=3330 RepID=A0A117NGJ2_PICGL|nr:hypothetical protein ABT39_MTgene6277 [Picea glauca]QHR87908.1 hypothetical protein Q903MT_gene1920 [Picea sitchensis]
MTFVNEIHTFVSTFEIEIPCLYDEIQFVIQSLMIVSQMLVVLYDTLYQNLQGPRYRAYPPPTYPPSAPSVVSVVDSGSPLLFISMKLQLLSIHHQ